MYFSKAISKTVIAIIVVVIIIIAALLGYYYATTAKPKYPSKPITVYVPWSAGGGTDRTTRAMAALLEKKFGVKFNVLNKVAGGGAATMVAGAKAAPDGYTLTAITIEISAFKWLGVADITYEDFEPIAMLICVPATITVRADAPWNSVQELVEYIREHPGELKASGTVQGGVWDIARIGFLKAVGLKPEDLPWVPSQGAAPALQELVAGGVDVVFCSTGEVKPLVEAGKAKVLAVLADERIPGIDAPTLKELGIDWAICGWAGWAAPKGTPKDIVETLAAAIKEAYYSDEFQDFLKKNAFVGKLLLTDEFKKYLEWEYTTFGTLLKEAGYVKE